MFLADHVCDPKKISSMVMNAKGQLAEPMNNDKGKAEAHLDA